MLPDPVSGFRWSVDPLDGTNFIRNIVYYGTSVAVAGPDGAWLAGVVHAPAGALIAEEAGCWVRRPRLTSVLHGGPTDKERLAAWTCAGPLELSGRFPL